MRSPASCPRWCVLHCPSGRCCCSPRQIGPRSGLPVSWCRRWCQARSRGPTGSSNAGRPDGGWHGCPWSPVHSWPDGRRSHPGREPVGWRTVRVALVAAAVTAILVALGLVALITLAHSSHLATRLALGRLALAIPAHRRGPAPSRRRFPGSGTHEQISALSPELREVDGSTDRVDRVGDAPMPRSAPTWPPSSVASPVERLARLN